MRTNIREGNQRLLKLAEHLRHGKLGHRKFDFVTFNSFEDKIPESKNVCGTNGCAVGECPVLFPDSWIFDYNGFPRLRELNERGHFVQNFSAAQKFFHLNPEECYHLFDPNNQVPEKFGGKHLDAFATKEEVAQNIEDFVKLREAKLGTPNARFWIHWNGDFVKITMSPGDNIGLHCGGMTDEGYYSHYEEYEYDGQRVYCILDTDSVDCDGRFSTSKAFSCEYDDLRGNLNINGVATPLWVKERSSQRDYEAEKAGY